MSFVKNIPIFIVLVIGIVIFSSCTVDTDNGGGSGGGDSGGENGQITNIENDIVFSSIIPADGATAVETSTVIVVTYSSITSQKVNITKKPIVIFNGKTYSDSEITLTDKAVIITPTTPFDTGTIYSSLEISGLKNSNDKDIPTYKNASYSFTTKLSAVVSDLQVSTISPADGSNNIETNSTIVITYSSGSSQKINTAKKPKVIFSGKTYSDSEISLTDTTITITPATPFDTGTIYANIAISGLKNAAGNDIAIYNENYQFTTKFSAILSDLTIFSLTPANGNEVPTNSKIVITYESATNQKINIAKKPKITFNGKIYSDSEISLTDTTVTITPSIPFTLGSTYSNISISGLKNTAGNDIPTYANSTYSFITNIPSSPLNFAFSTTDEMYIIGYGVDFGSWAFTPSKRMSATENGNNIEYSITFTPLLELDNNMFKIARYTPDGNVDGWATGKHLWLGTFGATATKPAIFKGTTAGMPYTQNYSNTAPLYGGGGDNMSISAKAGEPVTIKLTVPKSGEITFSNGTITSGFNFDISVSATQLPPLSALQLDAMSPGHRSTAVDINSAIVFTYPSIGTIELDTSIDVSADLTIILNGKTYSNSNSEISFINSTTIMITPSTPFEPGTKYSGLTISGLVDTDGKKVKSVNYTSNDYYFITKFPSDIEFSSITPTLYAAVPKTTTITATYTSLTGKKFNTSIKPTVVFNGKTYSNSEIAVTDTTVVITPLTPFTVGGFYSNISIEGLKDTLGNGVDPFIDDYYAFTISPMPNSPLAFNFTASDQMCIIGAEPFGSWIFALAKPMSGDESGDSIIYTAEFTHFADIVEKSFKIARYTPDGNVDGWADTPQLWVGTFGATSSNPAIFDGTISGVTYDKGYYGTAPLNAGGNNMTISAKAGSLVTIRLIVPKSGTITYTDANNINGFNFSIVVSATQP